MGIEQSIQLYTILFYACIAVAVLGFGFAAFFFFKFKIPLIFALETGKAKQKTIEKMMSTGDFGLKETEKGSHKVEMYDTMSGGLGTKQLTASGNLAQQSQPASDSMETTLLDAGAAATTLLDAGGAETTLLDAGGAETTLLDFTGETTVLAGGGDPETSVLSYTDEMSGQTVPLNLNRGAVYGTSKENTVDTGRIQIGRFDVIEQIVVVNSQEIL